MSLTVRNFELTPGQSALLQATTNIANAAIQRVREIEPKWSPTRGLQNTVEGHIRQIEAEGREAQARFIELQSKGICPGPWAKEWIPARGPGQTFTPAEREAIDRLGYRFGCHTCESKVPGTVSGHFVPDHQPPTSWNHLRRGQRLYPQCKGCSDLQGLYTLKQMMRPSP